VPHGVANAKELAMMARVLEAYCERFYVPEDPTVRDAIAVEILALFDHGLRDEEALLAEMIGRRTLTTTTGSRRRLAPGE